MNIEEAKRMLSGIFSSTERKIIINLQGSPGIGKTSCIAQAAKEKGLAVRTINLTTCEPVDLRGLPRVENGATVWASPMPKEGRGVLILDEISSAARDVQVAAHHVVWAEEGSDVSVGKGWHIVLTGNVATDRTIFHELGAPLRNRLTTLKVTSDFASWRKWAMANDIHDSIIGFLQFRSELLMAKTIPDTGAFPSPRSWEIASQIVKGQFFSESEMLLGTIGEGAAIEYMSYLRLFNELVSIEEIMNDPANTEIPKSPGTLYAVICGLARKTIETQKTYMEYVSRCPSEFVILYFNDIRDRYNIAKDQACLEWISEHKEYFKL